MRVCGIVAEYNPFHGGHARQCAAIRAKLDSCAIVSVMSGNYVQRGDMAIWDKYERAAFAVRCGGPDLVIELSLPHALGSAERFANGSVAQLLACGCLTHLSFGSECGDRDKLLSASRLMASPEFSELRNRAMQTGIGYAAACQSAVHELAPELEELISSPNDTLAIQYIRALGSAPVDILPITRTGAGHDQLPADGLPSASWLRRQMYEGHDVSQYFPMDISSIPCHYLKERELEILSYLRRLTADDWAALPDISEGLEYRLYELSRRSGSLDELIAEASSKRYTRSRIRRAVMCAWLGISAETARLEPQYIRVLAFNDRGRELLRTMKSTAALPVITKPLSGKALVGDAQRLWSLDMLADELYHFPAPAGIGWRQTPWYGGNL